MRKTKRKIIAALLLAAALLLLPLLYGCDNFTLPTQVPHTTLPDGAPGADTPSPEHTESAAPTVTSAGEASATTSPEQTATPAPTESAQPDPTQTPEPDPTPTPSPEPWHDGDRTDVVVTRYFTSTLPEGLQVGLLYDRYETHLDYFVVLKTSNVRELPDAKAKSLLRVTLAKRLELLAEVTGVDGKSVWYRVRVPGKAQIGYIPAAAGAPRVFQIDKALERAIAVKDVADRPDTVKIFNYKNKYGLPPQIGGKSVDPYGYRRDQAAPAYLMPDKKSSFRYAPDGMLGWMLGVTGDYGQVYFPTFDEVRYVPLKYLYGYKKDFIEKLTQVAVVDRKNQNIIVFEYKNEQWYVASFSFVSTGKSGKFSLPTPLGDYGAVQKREGRIGLGEFWYLADGADPNAEDLKFEGYAPYAVRFTAGAYLHGLPKGVSYVKDPETGKDKLVLPKTLTYESHTCLGTTAQSHMCVRNYTSHAKFLYNWMKVGSGAVIVIE